MGRLVAGALSVEPDERAEGVVDDLVEWLHEVLPEVRLCLFPLLLH